MKTMDDAINEKKEEFRKIMAKYFYIIGDDETYQDILTESEKRLQLDSYNYAISHFKECIKMHETIGKETT